MAFRRMKENLDRVLDKNLQDLVRGIRNHKDGEAKYISECLTEIKNELKSGDLLAKSNAINKLLHLQMLGYEISWAAFNIIEVMSSTKFTQKRCGYLVASQSFHVGTDVLMLATNMIRKDLSSTNMYDAGVALSGLSCFVSPDLAHDLAQDIMSLMTSTRPYLRKKSVLLMYKVYLNYPDALRPSFARLKERLEDQDPGVQSAAVNVICELARKNPKNYLSLAPTFFKLMTNSSNNWMLIKIIKLFGALTPLEPRLGKKLIEPLTNLIHSTSAMSLLYECINTVIAVLVSISSDLPNHTQSVQLCVQKLRVLIEDSDQNLKYLGLLAFSKILKTHPKSVQAHKDLVLSCLDDRDESIRMRALDLLHGMVSKKNLMDIVKKLMVHMEKAEGSYYRDELMSKIIQICSQNNYQHVVNFEWYVSVLIELTHVKSTSHGQLLASQMMDVAIRVTAIRKFTVSQMAILVENAHVFTQSSQKSAICEVLYAAVWLCGEFSEYLADPLATLNALFNPRVTSLPGHVQAVYVQNIAKLYSTILVKTELEEDQTTGREVGQLLLEKLPMFIASSDLEVQERACSSLQLIKYITKLLDKGVAVGEEVSFLFRGDLNPVAPKAQKKVPVPEGLNLDTWINKPPSKPIDLTKKKTIFNSKEESGNSEFSPKVKELTEEERDSARRVRLQAQEANPHYLKLTGGTKVHATPTPSSESDINVDEIPIETLNLNISLDTSRGLDGLVSADTFYLKAKEEERKKKNDRKKDKRETKKGKKKKRGETHSESAECKSPEAAHAVSSVYDMPEGMKPDVESGDDDIDATVKALDINLDEPLRDDERLPVRAHRTDGVLPEPINRAAESEVGDTKKKKKHSKEKKSKKSKGSSQNADAALIDVSLTTQAANAIHEPVVNGESSTPGSSKKKKSKSTGEKKSKSKRKKSEYEEQPETPNILPPDLASLNLSTYKPLATDSRIKLEMAVQVNNQQTGLANVGIVVTNRGSDRIKSLEFNVLNSGSIRLQRETPNEAVKMAFDLPSGSTNEARFVFDVDGISQSQRLNGTLTYIVKTEDTSTQEALDFKLPILCRDLLVAQPYSTDDFTQLLTSGNLTFKSSKKFRAHDTFHSLLTKLCFYGHLYVVESVENSASLYSRSIHNQHIALLVKKNEGDVSINGKSTDGDYLHQLLDELVEAVA